MNFYVFQLDGERFSNIVSSVTTETWDHPRFCRVGGQTLTRSLLSDSEELLLDSMPPTQIQGVFLLFLKPHSSKADLYHRYKLVLKGCHQGEVNCPQTRKVITTLIAVVY